MYLNPYLISAVEYNVPLVAFRRPSPAKCWWDPTPRFAELGLHSLHPPSLTHPTQNLRPDITKLPRSKHHTTGQHGPPRDRRDMLAQPMGS
jgi:hypothetical protein